MIQANRFPGLLAPQQMLQQQPQGLLAPNAQPSSNPLGSAPEWQWQPGPGSQDNPQYNYSSKFLTPPGYNMHPDLAYALGQIDPNWMMGRSLGLIPDRQQPFGP